MSTVVYGSLLELHLVLFLKLPNNFFPLQAFYRVQKHIKMCTDDRTQRIQLKIQSSCFSSFLMYKMYLIIWITFSFLDSHLRIYHLPKIYHWPSGHLLSCDFTGNCISSLCLSFYPHNKSHAPFS